MKKITFVPLFFILISKVASGPASLTSKIEEFKVSDELENQVEFKQFKFRNGKIITEERVTKLLDDEITYRLPNNTIPLRYDLWVKTDVEKEDFNFEGLVKIQIHPIESTDYVILQYRDIVIDRIDLLDIDTDVAIAENLKFTYTEPKTHEFLKIELGDYYESDFTLDISYHGELHEPDNNGFYKANYTNADGETVWYATTKFEPHHARHLMPCYDEPEIRAYIKLKVQHDDSYDTYSNMPLKNRIQLEGSNYVISEFEETPPMQTYLLAFLVSAFKFVENNGTDIKQRIFAKPQSIEDGEADYAASISDNILKKFEELLEVNYPLPKLDHVAITQFPSGAMENFGFISYREAALLLNKDYTDAQIQTYKKYIARVVSHEVAHQWFGNTVAPLWWTHLWLNEGFATLYEYFIPHLLFPDLGFYEEFRTSSLQSSLRNDIASNSLSVPMSHYVEEPTAIRGRFNFISYAKSGTVLMMFMEALGIDTFHKGLNKYLNDNYYGIGEPKKLFDALQSSVGDKNQLDIEAAMGSWTTQAGYPILRVERNENTLKFSQKRYPTGNDEIYSIPLTFATKSNADFDKKTAGYWINTKEQDVNVDVFGLSDTDWIIFNNQQVGYYRIDYSDNLWLEIANGLRNDIDKIHLINRRILQEELNIGMSVSKSIYASTMLDILSTLENEDSYLVWNDANNNIQFLNRLLFNTNVYEDYMKFLQTITKPIIDEIGYEATDVELAHITQLRLRVKTINCNALDVDCLEHEHTKLIKYREDETENSAPDFCSAFNLADKDIYDHFLNELITNPDLKNRNLIARTIHCTSNKDFLGILIVAIEDTTNNLTANERTNIINSMLISSSISFNVAFDYIKRNVEEINSFRAQLIAAINTQDDLDELKLLLAKALEDEIMTQTQADEIEAAIEDNLKWHDKHYDGISEFFLQFEERTTTERTTTSESGRTSEDSSTTLTAETTTLAANGLLMSFYLIIASLIVIKYL